MTLPNRQQWAQLNPLLEELLELDAGRRETRLAELRAQDATLAGDLALLLHSADQVATSDFLLGDALGSTAPSAALVGEQIGAAARLSGLEQVPAGVDPRAGQPTRVGLL